MQNLGFKISQANPKFPERISFGKVDIFHFWNICFQIPMVKMVVRYSYRVKSSTAIPRLLFQ